MCGNAHLCGMLIFASRFPSALVLVKFSYVLKEGNFMADALAKQGVNRRCELVARL